MCYSKWYNSNADIPDRVIEPCEFEITDFQGGLYAAAADIDQKTDKGLMDTEID